MRHLLRESLPWRKQDQLTECGRKVGGLNTTTIDEILASYDGDVSTLESAEICRTCWTTASRNRSSTWATSPVYRVVREASTRSAPLLQAELAALATLAENHFAEFEELKQMALDGSMPLSVVSQRWLDEEYDARRAEILKTRQH